MSPNRQPFISVLMAVYNSEKSLEDAIDSILSQTYQNFELIIVDDGSSDNSIELVSTYDDHRIVLVQNSTNRGLASSLNKGARMAKGKYIARMDADDISLPERFEVQVSFMESNQDIGVCGTWLKTFGGSRSTWKMPIVHEHIVMEMVFHSCLMHPTIMFRTEALLSLDTLYDDSFERAQDYDLWTRLAHKTRLANIPKVLLKYRVQGPSDAQFANREIQENYSEVVRKNYLKSRCIECSELELKLHNCLSSSNHENTTAFAIDTRNWLLKIRNSNEVNKFVSTEVCEDVLVEKYYMVCSALSKHVNTFPIFVTFSDTMKKDYFKLKVKLFLRCAVYSKGKYRKR